MPPAHCGPANVFPASHIGQWEPARVLAECEAKRQIVGLLAPDFPIDGNPYGLHGRSGDVHWHTLRLLALPYADRPGYQAEWAPA